MELLRLYLQIQSGNKINPLSHIWIHLGFIVAQGVTFRAKQARINTYTLRFLLKKKKKINRTLLIISKLNDSSVSIKHSKKIFFLLFFFINV